MIKKAIRWIATFLTDRWEGLSLLIKTPIGMIAAIAAGVVSYFILGFIPVTSELGRQIMGAAILITVFIGFIWKWEFAPSIIIGTVNTAIVFVTTKDYILTPFVFLISLLANTHGRTLLKQISGINAKPTENNIEEIINHNAGKILLQIYLIWKKESKMPDRQRLLEVTKLSHDQLERALKYCEEKKFIQRDMVQTPNGNIAFWIKDVTAEGIDSIEKKDERGNRRFNAIFNLNINVDSIIKGEAKLF